jgi:putative Ca2+/H+ antiporter (TMEM165/GDT1 family)
MVIGVLPSHLSASYSPYLGHELETKMDIKIILSTFAAVFLAEFGDKTQIAILGLSSESKKLISVFVGSAAAMLSATVLAVLFGGLIADYIPEKTVHMVAGLAFLVIGVLMFAGKL